jgi:hypothetical protein
MKLMDDFFIFRGEYERDYKVEYERLKKEKDEAEKAAQKKQVKKQL